MRIGLEQILGQREWLPDLRWGLLGTLIVAAGVAAYLFVIRTEDGE